MYENNSGGGWMNVALTAISTAGSLVASGQKNRTARELALAQEAQDLVRVKAQQNALMYGLAAIAIILTLAFAFKLIIKG